MSDTAVLPTKLPTSHLASADFRIDTFHSAYPLCPIEIPTRRWIDGNAGYLYPPDLTGGITSTAITGIAEQYRQRDLSQLDQMLEYQYQLGLSPVMLDTVNLSFKIDDKRSDWLERIRNRFSPGKKIDESKTWEYFYLGSGITLLVASYRFNRKLCKTLPMIMRISPYKYGLISPFLNWEVEGKLLVHRIRSVFESKLISLVPDFMRHNVSKMEIKRDFRLPDTLAPEDIIDRYGSLFSLRGNRINGIFEGKDNLDEKTGVLQPSTAYINRSGKSGSQVLCRIYIKPAEAEAHGDPACQPNVLRAEVVAHPQDIKSMRNSNRIEVIPEEGMTLIDCFNPEILTTVVAHTEKLADIQPELEICTVEELKEKIERSRLHKKTKKRLFECLHRIERGLSLSAEDLKYFRSKCLKLEATVALNKPSCEQVCLRRLTEQFGIRDPRIDGLDVERAEELRRRDMEEFTRLQSNRKSYRLPTNKENKNENRRSPSTVSPVLHTVSSRPQFDIPVEVTLPVISSASSTYYTLPGSDRAPPIGFETAIKMAILTGDKLTNAP